ncbi:hypothetical protein JCM6882_000751 [Rhodosporidiobolus microsporus]
MPGKRASKPSTTGSTAPKTRSSSNRSSTLKAPSLLPLSKPQLGKAKKRGAQKARDADAREKLDKGGMELREALTLQKKKALVKKQEAPPELARGGDQLANSLDDLSVAFGAA